MNHLERLLLAGCLCLLNLIPTCAQHHIEALLPQLRERMPELLSEVYDNVFFFSNGDDQQLLQEVNLRCRRTDMPTSLLESLTHAMEAELPLATESDRYQKHAGHDTLSILLAYDGNLTPNDDSNIEFYPHRFNRAIRAAAILDVYDDEVRFTYINRTPLTQLAAGYDFTPVSQFLAATARRSGVKVQDVEYTVTTEQQLPRIRIFKINSGIGRQRGVRYEVPAAQADDVEAAASSILNGYKGQRQCFVIFHDTHPQGYRAAFGTIAKPEILLTERKADGRLFLLHAWNEEGQMCLPGNWTDITHYNDGDQR